MRGAYYTSCPRLLHLSAETRRNTRRCKPTSFFMHVTSQDLCKRVSSAATSSKQMRLSLDVIAILVSRWVFSQSVTNYRKSLNRSAQTMPIGTRESRIDCRSTLPPIDQKVTQTPRAGWENGLLRSFQVLQPLADLRYLQFCVL